MTEHRSYVVRGQFQTTVRADSAAGAYAVARDRLSSLDMLMGNVYATPGRVDEVDDGLRTLWVWHSDSRRWASLALDTVESINVLAKHQVQCGRVVCVTPAAAVPTTGPRFENVPGVIDYER